LIIEVNHMKTNFLRYFAVLVFAGALYSGHAQISFVPGYLINGKGDTLRGELKINPKKEYVNHDKAFFKDPSGVQKNYKPEKVKGYGFADNHYVSFTEDDEARFYKRLANGSIVLYKCSFEVINKNEVSYDYEYFLYKEGDKKLTPVKENKFKKQLQEWMNGSELANDYQEDKKFNVESAIDVVNKYNDWKKNN